MMSSISYHAQSLCNVIFRILDMKDQNLGNNMGTRINFCFQSDVRSVKVFFGSCFPILMKIILDASLPVNTF
jgi:hypothetical protein